MEDYMLKAIQEGKAIDKRDTFSLKEEVSNQLNWLKEYLGEERTNEIVDQLTKLFIDKYEYAAIYKVDIEENLMRFIPRYVMEAYSKMLKEASEPQQDKKES